MYVKWFKNSCTVKPHSNMFRWQPPLSSGKSNSMNQNTTSVSCLSYHAQDRQLKIAVFLFVELNFPDGGGSHHRNMLECGLTV